jgi:nitrate/TMAO reductase-like tetraheme cytochrome c subunit
MTPRQENPWGELSRASGGELTEWLSWSTILVAVAGMVLIVAVMARCRRRPMDATAKWLALLGLGVLPAFTLVTGTGAVVESAKTPQKCMTCHVMEPYGKDMMDSKSDSLAAAHFRNRWIRENQCYECHSHYGMFGNLEAKLDGVGHLYHYLTDSYERPIRMRRPYPIHHCLKCHGESDAFLRIRKHSEPETVEGLKSGKISCLECHEAPHPRGEK